MLWKSESSWEHQTGRLHFPWRIRGAFWVRNKQELAPQRGWRMVFQRRANAEVLEWERALRTEAGEQGWHCLELMRLAGAVLSCTPVSSVPYPEQFSPPACVRVRNVFMFVAPISCLLLVLCIEKMTIPGSESLSRSLITFVTSFAKQVLRNTIRMEKKPEFIPFMRKSLLFGILFTETVFTVSSAVSSSKNGGREMPKRFYHQTILLPSLRMKCDVLNQIPFSSVPY